MTFGAVFIYVFLKQYYIWTTIVSFLGHKYENRHFSGTVGIKADSEVLSLFLLIFLIGETNKNETTVLTYSMSTDLTTQK